MNIEDTIQMWGEMWIEDRCCSNEIEAATNELNDVLKFIRELKEPSLSLDTSIAVIRNHISDPNMSDELRYDFFNRITEGYCTSCGSKQLPCYCERDD